MLSDRLDDAVLVVAHPDDEILWFSSILDRVGKIVICFLDVPGQPEWSAGRRQVVRDYPLKQATFLGLTESVAFAGADWRAPVTTNIGIDVQRRQGTFPAFSRERYESNFGLLQVALRVHLAGCSVVITHNPWGEYGHEEHVQVHRAVTSLQDELPMEVWYSNYCSERSCTLMLREVAGIRCCYQSFPTNPSLAAELEALYRRHGCWTWPFDAYARFASESFVKRGSHVGNAAAGSTWPLNFVNLADPPPPVPKVNRFVRAAKRRLSTLKSSQ